MAGSSSPSEMTRSLMSVAVRTEHVVRLRRYCDKENAGLPGVVLRGQLSRVD